MHRILIIVFFIPKIIMSQIMTFDNAVQQLYFNVDITNKSIDSIINQFNNVAIEHNVSKSQFSLSINLDMNTSGHAKKNHMYLHLTEVHYQTC